MLKHDAAVDRSHVPGSVCDGLAAGWLARYSGGMSKKRDVVQVKNPKTGRYVKIDRSKGRIVSHKKTKGPYKGIPVARKKRKR